MFGGNAMKHCLITGVVVWLGGTIALRFFGQYVLHPESLLAIAMLFVLSFPLMAWVARRICADAALPPERWPLGGFYIVMPTLVFDAFASAFFPLVYPNMPESAAGLFGGWMLWCCAGALFGLNFRRQ
jgi:hypothetical protein